MQIQVIGRGRSAVYVYYYPKYQQHHDNYYWPCKIGMSRHSAVQRIANQVKTALPEYPVVGLIVKTDQAAVLEQLLHNYLTLKQRKVDSPGTEWYLTTPDEIVTILKTLRLVN